MFYILQKHVLKSITQVMHTALQRASLYMVALFLLLFVSSCRDRGSFAWSGTLLDTCSGGALAGATIRVHTPGGYLSTTSNNTGDFSITGSWNEPCPLGNCKTFPPELTLSYVDSEGVQREFVLFPPTGTVNFGDLVLSDTLHIPISFVGDTTGCGGCTATFYLNQDVVLPFPNFGETVFLSQLPTTVSFYRPLAYKMGSAEPAFPVLVSYTIRSNNEEAVRYPEINITGLITRCGTADTLFVSL